MAHFFHMPITAADRHLHFDLEVSVHTLKDGRLEARCGDQSLGTLCPDRPWVTSGPLPEPARRALVQHWLDLQKDVEAGKELVVMGERVRMPPRPTPGDVRLRRLRGEADIEAARQLFVQSWVENYERFETTDPSMYEALCLYVRESLDGDLLRLETEYERVWVAEACGRVLGMVAVRADGELRRLAVHPSARGLGLASALVDRVERHVRRRGLPRVHLTTGAFMPAACRLYTRRGYTFDGSLFVPRPTSRDLCLVFTIFKYHKDL